jgi:penicillin-binding protein 2
MRSPRVFGEDWKAISDHPDHPLLNRFLKSAYPWLAVQGGDGGTPCRQARSPGQTMRTCDGGYPFGNRYFHCHHVHGTLAFTDAMRVSCDTYFYQAGLKVGLEALGDYTRRFGFGQPTGMMPGEKSGNFPDRAW